ncbi:tRNA guanosine(34) transglycosylase Tgt [Candidatus Falkowbacteria bacterium]|uniref:Queuine tRNA-ribosyltransferase n=1 Tax=Candidatus Buchananbacteria bacterium CG10_big_fil_rev_8_21_14_0_10_33_19 TaxID=1974525 RepID=A0A2H0W5U7_9BACT|nr:tRNA guanosine(34) transglycosylase Tgt [Candidatus Falkowbacteria bacterium]PIS06020.1 MAG: tRNA guanosine(34) transglycosylase Tgt [Candidatus Buchananbacteria bacterium CG10_big_fil_rev_8_21_14_0_10_33_19]
MYEILKESKKTKARLGKLKTAHGFIGTPFFMPIATKAAVKHLTTGEVKSLGAQIILSNTYHLYLQPGLDVLKKQGGLHKMMNWSGPILTDSGGFQVFSLSKIRKIMPHGVEFNSHIDGSRHTLTPKKVLEIQKIIGSDIAMILDVCPSSKDSKAKIREAVDLTTAWAKEAKKYKKTLNSKQLMFGIVQGGLHQDLRERSLKDLVKLDFDGYAIGGLAVGESNQEMYSVLDYLVNQMPEDKPRYLMGVGTPDNIVAAVKRGVDMFDCVIPTREARHGRLYIRKKSGFGAGFYETINIANAKFKNDKSSINKTNLKQYSRAYLYQLFKTNEPLGMRLATLNNLEFYLSMMSDLRIEIKKGKF